MQLRALDPHRMLGWVPVAGDSVRLALRWAATHSGLPVVVVAAVGLVMSWHLFRRTLRWTVEVAFALALLLVATRLGWISW